jgi:hypothetical protein
MGLPVIAVVNQSTVLSDSQVFAVLRSMQIQCTSHLRPYWGADCTLTSWPKTQPIIPGWWQLLVIDDPDQAGALGYHELSSVGGPLGKIFARLDMQAGTSWTVTFSHELLEMLVDPWINFLSQGSDNKLYACEIGDAVEADALAYSIDGVLVSDFITPAWFQPTFADRLDFKRHLTAPLTLAPGGYISILDPATGWTQITARDAKPALRVLDGVAKKVIPEGSRRHRRTIAKAYWKRSMQ